MSTRKYQWQYFMRSIIKNVHRNGHSLFFASDEWRGWVFDQQRDHTKLPWNHSMKRPRSATRSAAKNECGGSFFRDSGSWPRGVHESLANCSSRSSLSLFSWSFCGCFGEGGCIVSDYNGNSTRNYHSFSSFCTWQSANRMPFVTLSLAVFTALFTRVFSWDEYIIIHRHTTRKITWCFVRGMESSITCSMLPHGVWNVQHSGCGIGDSETVKVCAYLN